MIDIDNFDPTKDNIKDLFDSSTFINSLNLLSHSIQEAKDKLEQLKSTIKIEDFK